MNPFSGFSPLAGTRIIEDPSLTDMTEDWSRVRSPGRARRRMKYGHRQNVRFVSKPKMEAYSLDGGRTLIMHPAMAHALRKASCQVGSEGHEGRRG